jgi:hypothetical protein
MHLYYFLIGCKTQENVNLNKRQEIHRATGENGNQKDVPQYDVFNIGSDDTITVLEIAKRVIDQLSIKNEM